MQKQSKQNNNILDRQNDDYNIDENDKLNKGQQQEEENAIVYLNNVSFEYKHHNILLSLNNIFFNIFEGDILIIGPNSSRKTTLFHCIMKLQNKYSGNILLFNQNIHKKIKSNEIMMAFSNDIISKALKGVKGKSGT
jgi:ABC-type bacteriocin/lantibiotic exporter with double-glycine peptidase domain